ncbi:MAG: replication factor C large subunit, partial [Euryarchaeota archaeon]|nr:replication factor C large subunit [Euryarchaeota archaeon]
DDIATGERDTKENIFKMMAKIFKGTDIIETHKATFGLDENPEDLIQWVDENLPLEYAAPSDLERGYYYLSRASLFLGRVKRRQNYNMWRYASVLMTSGIMVARTNRYHGFVKYQPPSLWRKLGQTKGIRNVRDSIAKKIGTYCHVSMSYTRSQLFPFFKMAINNDEYAPSLAAVLRLEPEEIAFLAGSRSVTKKIQKIFDDAQLMIEKETEHEIELFGGFGAKSDSVTEDATEDEPEVEVKKETKSQRSLFDF